MKELLSEIEILEAEMLGVLRSMPGKEGIELEEARNTLAEICAAYEIAIGDISININVNTHVQDFGKAYKQAFKRKAGRRSTAVRQLTPICNNFGQYQLVM